MKHIITILSVTTLLTGLGGAAALADPPGDPAQHLDHLAQALGLSEQQKASARKIHDEVAPRAKPLHEQARRQHQEIEALLDSGNPDPADVGRRVIAVWTTHKQLRALHEQTLNRIRTLLTADQKARLDRMIKEHGMHGPGMHPFGGH